MNTDNTLLLAALEPCWLWWLILSLLAFLLGFLLGALLFSNRKRLRELEEENARLKSNLTTMEKDFMSLKYQHEETTKEREDLKRKLRICEADKSVIQGKFDRLKAEQEAASGSGIAEGDEDKGAKTDEDKPKSKGLGGMVFATPLGKIKQDDLKIVEGIGPKIEGLLNADGITTWAELAASSVERLQEILTAAGERYRLAVPNTWPRQAGLANEGKWDELKELQDQLKGGKE
ncbi:MAG: 50S ribosomal protein L27 [Phaeodactylibacter sp.]|nr:50S ribosomal protein L27 [Phaeodactylibacter sp.]